MTGKQIWGITVAAIAVLFVGLFGSFYSEIAQDTGGDTLSMADHFAVVNIVGTIENTSGDELGLNQPSYHHTATVNYVKNLQYDNSNTGIFLYFNTGGGGVYESDELYRTLMDYKEATGRPVVAFFGPMAASGGYYISMAADHISADRNTTTGSIGVIMSYTNVKGLYDKLGIHSEYITSGKNKSMGASDLDLTDEQRAIFQGVVNEAYAQFVGIVADGRSMDETTVRQLADGRIYTAKQALGLGLIDEIGTYDDAIDAFSSETSSQPYYTDFSETSVFDRLLGAVANALPKSDSQVLQQLAQNDQSGVPLYELPN